MPKKKSTMTQAQQSKKFLDTARALIDAGELNLTEADDKFENVLSKVVLKVTEPERHSHRNRQPSSEEE